MNGTSSYCFTEQDFLAITKSLAANSEKRDHTYRMLKEYNKSIRQQFINGLISKILSEQILQNLTLIEHEPKIAITKQLERDLTGEIHLDLSGSNKKQSKADFKSNTFSSENKNGRVNLSSPTVFVLI